MKANFGNIAGNTTKHLLRVRFDTVITSEVRYPFPVRMHPAHYSDRELPRLALEHLNKSDWDSEEYRFVVSD
jgi:hypothetical protein